MFHVKHKCPYSQVDYRLLDFGIISRKNLRPGGGLYIMAYLGYNAKCFT